MTTPSLPLYQDEEGRTVTTHSMIKAFRHCPKKTEYKYVRRLRPKRLSAPLSRGQTLHSMLEAYYLGKDWRKPLAEYRTEYNKLFDEEKDNFTDLTPDGMERLFRGYRWHYQDEEWEVLDVERTIEAEFPDGTIFRGRVDMIIRDQFGVWIVDHKSHTTLPDVDFRIIDSQSAIYLWAAMQNDIPASGFIFNYLLAKAPSVPKPIKSGARISRWDSMRTDYPTAIRGLREHGFYTKETVGPYVDKLKVLKAQRYAPGEPQTSPFFQRQTLEKSGDMLKRVAMEAYHTSRRMHSYFPAPHPDAVERIANRSCKYQCSYLDICTAELFQGEASSALMKAYETDIDPLDYYNPEEDE